MGIWFGIGFFFLLAIISAVCAVVGGRVSRDYKGRWIGFGVLAFVVFALVGGIIWFTSALVTVDARNVGMVLLYGKLQPGHLTNGRHLINPAADVIEWDEAIQTTSFLGKNCLQVKLAGQQNACAPVSIQWRIKPDAVDDLYKNYRSFSGMRNNLVIRSMEQATTQQLAGYSPINEIESGAKPGAQLVSIGKQIGNQMRGEIGGQVEVTKVLLLPMNYDEQTSRRLQALQQAVVNTAIAKQLVKTNAQKATANRKLAASVSHDPNVLTAQCLSTIDEMVQKGMNPAGINCWPGGGGSSAVVIPAGGR